MRILIMALLLAFVFSTAQTEEESEKIFFDEKTDTIYVADVYDAFKINHQGTVAGFIQKAWKANQDPSYLTIAPFVSPIAARRVPLRNGEGSSSNFSLMEANLNFQFTLMQGKEKWPSNFWKMNRLTFDYNGTFRMLLDESKPLTPSNQRVGLSWNTNIWTSLLGCSMYSTDSAEKKYMRPSTSDKRSLEFVNFKTSVHHFSNGQSPGFFYTDLETGRTRNDYQSGDFSTNYLLFEGTYGKFNTKSNNLHQFSLGYRQDWGQGEDGFLIFSKEQEGRYGKHRLYGVYDYRNGFSNGNELHLRMQMWSILSELDRFQANLKDANSKYRIYGEFALEFSPRYHKTIGYFLRIFYGRDYLNIRFDDIIFTTQFGISLNLDKYISRPAVKEVAYKKIE
ncbi:MAG: hypothetical protein ACI9WL_000059 [Rubritalea sp.]|jgi:hypothetical protein